MGDPLGSVSSATRVCRTCGVSKQLTAEFFPPQRGYADGFVPHCRVCVNARNKAYKADQRTLRGATRKRRPRIVEGVEQWECKTPGCGWHDRSDFYDSTVGDWPRPFCKPCYNQRTIANQKRPEVRERTRQRERERRKERQPHVVRKMSERAERHARGVRVCKGCGREFPFAEFQPKLGKPTGVRARCRKCRNLQAVEYARRDYERDPERVLHRGKTRRAMVRGSELCDLTTDEWRRIRLAYGDHCAFCGRLCHDDGPPAERITQEHDIPVTRGGWHSASNVFPACLSCNASKNDRTAAEYEVATGVRLDRSRHPLLQLRFDVPLPRPDKRKPFPVPKGWNRLLLACDDCRQSKGPLCDVCRRRVQRWQAGKKPRKLAPRFAADGTELHLCQDPKCALGWQPISEFYADPRGGHRSKCKSCFSRDAAERNRR